MTARPAILEGPMSEPDLQNVEELFQAAADLPPDERTSFLDERCGDDPSLRGRLDALLTQFDRHESLLSPCSSGLCRACRDR